MNSKKKIIAAVLVIFIIIGGLFLIGKSGFSILSGLRAFVGGEGLWAKGQKDATFQLTQYVFSGEANRYQLFVDSLKVPLGDKSARLELEKTDPVDEIIIQGFSDGGNHPADIPSMIFLYKYFKNLNYIRKAIEQWQEGDRLIEDLLEIGVQTNHAIINNNMSKEQAVQTLAAIDNLQKKLNEAEDLFSSNMSSAARETANQLSVIMLCFSLVGIILCFIMLRLIVGIISDLSHKKKLLENQAEQESQFKKALKKSEEKYRNIYTNAQVGLARTQISTGKIIDCNDKMAQIFNYENTEDFITEFTFSDNYVDTQLRVWLLNEIKKTGVLNNVEAEFYGKDKSKVWVRFDTRIFPDKGYMEDVVVDITESKIGEKALIESENRFRDISLSMADWIWETDSESKFTYISQSIKGVLGYDPEELIGKTPFDLMPEDESVRVKEIVSKIVSNSENIKELENWNINKWGHRLYMLTNGIPIIDNKGKTKGYRGINKDITDQRRLESQLQQAQKMESIGTLAGGIAHDFNNILFPIVGHTEMLLEDVPEDSPLRHSLNGIYTSALRAKDLVKQILTFSRQDSSELILMKMQPIIKEALNLIRSTIPTTIEINQDINPDGGIIKANPTQIHQIVMNLATNAYHAMEETGGVLKVSLKEIELGEHDLIAPDMIPGLYACLIVADTGKGMDKNLTDKIFDPFFTTKEKGKGTGMGLSVVHGIVTVMGGYIQVYSKPGKGTQFHVYLPVEKSLYEKQETNSKAEAIQGGIEQILLVDDEEAILTMEKLMLERLGYKITSRTSSLEALEAFRADPDKFDLIITDMAMPNMRGDKLSAELIKIRPDIPVLLCTGFSEVMSEKKATSLGIKGFLLKPIVMKDLSHKIREVLDEIEAEEAG